MSFRKVRRLAGLLAAAPGAALWAGPAYAAGELPPLVHDIGMALFLSGVLAILFARIKFPPIAGYILGGLIGGPLALRLVTDPANIDTIAQLGFVLLLFVIGLEMDLKKILSSGRTIVVTGLLSVPSIAVFGFLAAKLLALIGLGSIVGDNLGALYVGLAISVSSTLLVVKLFQETFELDTVPGRLSLGILVMEDLWSIIFILLQPQLQHPEILSIVGSFIGIGVLAVLAFLISRTLIPLAFQWVAKMPEIILVGAIGWCFAVVFMGASFDGIAEALFGWRTHFNVGAGMGALIAGATIASLPYSIEIVTKVSVVKDFFVTLFFVGLGLSIPAPGGPAVFVLAFIIAALAIGARQLILFPLLYFAGADQRHAEVTAVRMAQISEFSLVVTFLAISLGHVSRDLGTAIVLAFVLTSLTTTPLFKSAYQIYMRVKPVLTRIGFKEPPAADEGEGEEFAIALLGLHRDGSSFLHELLINRPELIKKTLVIDYNVRLHEKIRALGAHVEYGDISNPETLLHAGVDKARIVFCTISDDLLRGITNRELVRTVRKLSPGAVIIANSVDTKAVKGIYEAGANYVYSPRVEVARALSEVLGHALAGSLEEFKALEIAEEGELADRREVIS